MTSPLSSGVRATFGLSCPKCGGDSQLQISIATWIDLTAEGSTVAEDGPHEWHDLDPCRCLGCAFAGRVMDFETSHMEVQP